MVGKVDSGKNCKGLRNHSSTQAFQQKIMRWQFQFTCPTSNGRNETPIYIRHERSTSKIFIEQLNSFMRLGFSTVV